MRPLTRSRHRRHGQHRPGVLAVAAATVVVLAGCSGGGDATEGTEPSRSEASATDAADPADPAQALQDAVSETVELQAFSIDSQMELQFGPQDISLDIGGSVDYDAAVADVVLEVAQGGSQNRAHVLSDGEQLWIDIEGPQTPEFPGGATWLQGDASRLSESTTFTPTGLLGAVLVLRGAGDVEAAGTDEVDGVTVTRYATTFTYDDAAAAVSGDEAAALEGAFSLTGAASSLELDVEASVGEDGVLREIDLEIVEEDGVPAAGTYDLELTDVGGDIAPPEQPDPDEVATGPKAEALLDRIIT